MLIVARQENEGMGLPFKLRQTKTCSSNASGREDPY